MDHTSRSPAGRPASLAPASIRFRAWLTPFFGLTLSDLEGSGDLPGNHPLLQRLLDWKVLADAKDYARLFAQIVEESGHDPNLIQAVQGFGETGAALARSAVNTILFIGSVGNGRRVAAGAAGALALIPGLSGIALASASGAVYVGLLFVLRAVPPEVIEAFVELTKRDSKPA